MEFERATRLDPDLADGWNGLGWSRLKLVQGAPEERVIAAAEEAFREALRRDPELADGWLGLAQVRFLRRESPADLLTALEAIRAARQADPSSLFRHDYRSWADVYALEGWCYYYLGDPDAARDRLRRALQEDPSQPAALRLQAQLP
ncbi:MAG: hypothetical protein KatS3mg115_0935 [Candidatus Poribacteria bacterium]|nr:MAG: hypothetical protein KatS3mg115_0935 [Candidatus Poribacteria bacterium]